MPAPAKQITLSIGESDAAPHTFEYHVLLDGEVVASNRGLSAAESRSVRDLTRRFGALFEQHLAPRLALDAQERLGNELFVLWLADVWHQIEKDVPTGTSRTLVIASDVAAILNLPWELLRFPGGDFAGFDPTLHIRRLPRRETSTPSRLS